MSRRKAVVSQTEDMFATKPTSPTLEFAELRLAFTVRQLGEAFDRDPDTVTRWAKRVPHTAESVVDRFWYVMHVAVTRARWDLEETRWFLLSIQPRLGDRVPAELVREGKLKPVVEAITTSERATNPKESPMGSSDSVPFAHMTAPEPLSSEEIFGIRLAPPDVRRRVRPLGGVDDDDFHLQLTADKAVAVAAGSLED